MDDTSTVSLSIQSLHTKFGIPVETLKRVFVELDGLLRRQRRSSRTQNRSMGFDELKPIYVGSGVSTVHISISFPLITEKCAFQSPCNLCGEQVHH